MAELFASLESGPAAEDLRSRQSVAAAQPSPATARHEDPGVRPDRAKTGTVDDHTDQAQSAAAARLPLDGKLNGSAPEDDRILRQSDHVPAAAEVVKRDRSCTLGPPREENENCGTPELELQPPTPAAAVEEYRTKAVEFMNTNVNAILDYAQRLASVRSPAEIVALSTIHAYRHFELIMTHTAALGALSQSLTRTDAERMTVSIAKAFSQQKD